MTEGAPISGNSYEKEHRELEKIALAKELFERGERFPFPGINPEYYAKQLATDEEYPGDTTHIDEIIRRLQNEGMKIVLGQYPESGGVFVLPFGSDDIENDSISPHHLKIDVVTDERLRKLISLSRR